MARLNQLKYLESLVIDVEIFAQCPCGKIDNS